MSAETGRIRGEAVLIWGACYYLLESIKNQPGRQEASIPGSRYSGVFENSLQCFGVYFKLFNVEIEAIGDNIDLDILEPEAHDRAPYVAETVSDFGERVHRGLPAAVATITEGVNSYASRRDFR